MRGGRRWWLLLFAVAFLPGCVEDRPETAGSSAEESVELGQEFDAAATGTIQGKVTWTGPIPEVSPFHVQPSADSQPEVPRAGPRANPHAPMIDPVSRGVSQAVVFLRKVDPRRCKPWDLKPVVVEQEDWKLQVRQGSTLSGIGFVRRGDKIQAVSKQRVLHILRASGAAYFSIAFADVDVPSTKRLEHLGHVELSSGADYYWMRAHLFVADHPYYTCSDLAGNFVLSQVPRGTYEVVCWLPNWKIASHDRDSESSQIGRVQFCEPLVIEKTVTVAVGSAAELNFTFTTK